MAIDFLQDIEHAIDSGRTMFACPSHQGYDWHLSTNLEDLRPKAQRTANSKKYEVYIYRLINKMDAGEGDAFLYCKRMLEPSPNGEPHVYWGVVDTRDAAEMMRDVSQGPSPYFGITIEESFQPKTAG